MCVCGCVGCVVHMYGDVLVGGTHCACFICVQTSTWSIVMICIVNMCGCECTWRVFA